jgi:hypothetical protein
MVIMPHEKRQLRTGPHSGLLSYKKPPPGPPVQKTFRASSDFIYSVEDRALQESLRLGREVRFSELIRRGLQMVLDSPLPEPVTGPRIPCALVPMAGGGVACVECRVSAPAKGSINCPELKREVSLGE